MAIFWLKAFEVDGHNERDSYFRGCNEKKGKPIVIIAHTIKGKDVFCGKYYWLSWNLPKRRTYRCRIIGKGITDIDAPGFDQKKADRLLKIACDYQQVDQNKTINACIQ